MTVRGLLPFLAAVLAIGLALRFFTATQYLLLGLLGAGCFAALEAPLARRVPGPRWVGAVLAGMLPWVVLGGALVGLGALLGTQLSSQLASWPEIHRRVDGLLAEASGAVGVQRPPTLDDVAQEVGGLLTGAGGAKLFATGASVLTGAGVSLAFLVFGSIFLLAGDEQKLLAPLDALLSRDRADEVRAALDELAPKLRWWLLGTTISMTVIGVATGLGYALVGLELALPLALLAGLAEIVPTFGPLAAYLVALLLAATQGPGTMLAVTAVYVVIQLLESYLLVPYVMRKAVDVPPLVTLFTVVFWGQVLGAGGLLLAIPLDLAVWAFVDRLVVQPRRTALAPDPPS